MDWSSFWWGFAAGAGSLLVLAVIWFAVFVAPALNFYGQVFGAVTEGFTRR